jgi:hypothetical protein
MRLQSQNRPGEREKSLAKQTKVSDIKKSTNKRIFFGVPTVRPRKMQAIEQTIESLVGQLNGPDTELAKAAGEKLDKLLYPRYLATTTGGQRVTIPKAHDTGLQGFDPLKSLLRTLAEGSDYGREYAATFLSAIKEPRAILLLLAALDENCPKVREWATQALAWFQDPSAAAALIARLGDSTSSVRHWAAFGLGLIENRDAVPSLMRLFETGDNDDKSSVLFALGRIADPRFLPFAREALSHTQKRVRRAAKSAISSYDFKRRRAEQNAGGNP